MRLCTFPVDSAMLSRDLEILVDVKKSVAPYLATPSSYRQSGLTSPGVDYSGAWAVNDDDRYSRAIEAALPPQTCPSSAKSSDAFVDLIRWMEVRVGRPDPYAEVPDFASWSEAETAAWVESRLKAIDSPC